MFAFRSTPGSVFMTMEKAVTLVRTIAPAAVSAWFGFVLGQEYARKEIRSLMDDLRRQNPSSDPQPPHS